MDHQIGDYRLDHLIGHGATGEVWLAWDRGVLGRPVAIKRIRAGGDGRSVDALFDEAQLLAGVDHPHLVPVVAALPDGEGLAIVMPYLAGGSLATLLEERGTVGPAEVVALLEPLAEAVDALGRRGLVHGDLKPGNVMLTGDGQPVLVDVGLARVRRPLAGPDRPTIAGTPEYLDPAVARGAAPGPRSEVYSLGVMAYECLTGRVPHRGEPAEVVAVAGAGAHRRLHSWPTVPRAVADVVEAALQPDPDRRPADAGRFAADLRAAVTAHASEHRESVAIRLPGISRRALASPVSSAGRHTVGVPVDGDGTEEGDAPPRTRRRAVAVGLVAMGLLAGVIAVTSNRPQGRASDDARPVEVSSALHHAAGCPPRPEPHPLPPRQVDAGAAVEVDVDVDGDGCLDLARWDGHHLVVTGAVGTRSYRLGRPGDQALFGDWDGDGLATPALYRPDTGEVLYTDRFPAEIGDRETAARVEQIGTHGTAAVRPDETSSAPRDLVVLLESP